MNQARRITSVVVQGAILLAAVALAAVLVVPRMVGWDVLTVLTGSMAPTYPAETVLAVKPVDPDSIRVGQVIAFRAGPAGRPVTHRVVEMRENEGGRSFVTKGDANEEPDADPVTEDAVRGRVVFGVVGLGRLLSHVRSPIGFGLMVAFVGGLASSDHIAGWVRRRRNRGASAPSARPAPSTPVTVSSPVITSVSLDAVPSDGGLASVSASRPAADSGLQRQLVLVRLGADRHDRHEIVSLAALHGAEVAEITATSVVLSLVATPDAAASFERLVAEFPVIELRRSTTVDLAGEQPDTYSERPMALVADHGWVV